MSHEPLRRDKTAATEGSAYLGSFYCVLADLPVPPDTEVVLVRGAQYDSLATIIRDLATLGTFHDDFGYAIECRCPTREHRPACPWRRAVEWVRDTDQEAR